MGNPLEGMPPPWVGCLALIVVLVGVFLLGGWLL